MLMTEQSSLNPAPQGQKNTRIHARNRPPAPHYIT